MASPHNRSDLYSASPELPSVVFVSVLMSVGVAGNILVLYIFSQYYTMSTYRVFVRILAIVDLLMCVTYMPLDILFQGSFNANSELFCKIFRYFVYGCNYLSFFLLVFIAAERHRRICSPLKKQLSMCKARVIAIFAIFLSLFLAVPGFFTNGDHNIQLDGNITNTVCGTDDDYQGTKLNIIYYGIIGSIYITSTIYLVLVYLDIIRNLFKRKRTFRHHRSFESSKGGTSSDRSEISSNGNDSQIYSVRSTWSIIFITVIFIIVYAPYIILCCVIGFKPQFMDSLHGTARILCRIAIRLHMINNVANPFVYGFTDNRFRKACKTVYRKLICYTKVGGEHSAHTFIPH